MVSEKERLAAVLEHARSVQNLKAEIQFYRRVFRQRLGELGRELLRAEKRHRSACDALMSVQADGEME